MGNRWRNSGNSVRLYFLGLQKSLQMVTASQFVSTFGKLSSGHRTGKGQFSFQSQRKAMPKNAQTVTQLHSSHTQVKCNAQNSPSQASAIREL